MRRLENKEKTSDNAARIHRFKNTLKLTGRKADAHACRQINIQAEKSLKWQMSWQTEAD